MGVGAELSTLAELHKTFTNKAEDAESIRDEVDNSIGAAEWSGKAANDFRDAWDEYKNNLTQLRQALDGAADDVKTNHNNIAEATGESDRI